MSGRLFVVLGPSGAGKDTLIAGAVARRPELLWARRVVTRPEAAGGEPYEGVSREEFERRRSAGLFAVWWEAHGLLYGAPATIGDEMEAGRDVILNGSRGAVGQARMVFPHLKVIYVTAPEAVLARRLAARGRESKAEIAQRLARAAFPPPKDAVVVQNDGSVEEGVSRLLAALTPPMRNAG